MSFGLWKEQQWGPQDLTPVRIQRGKEIYLKEKNRKRQVTAILEHSELSLGKQA